MPVEPLRAVLWSRLTNYLPTIDSLNENSFWIGLTDTRVEGTLEWITSGQPIAYFNNWLSPSEPQNLANIDCVRIGLTNKRFWIMDDCANLNYALCEPGS